MTGVQGGMRVVLQPTVFQCVLGILMGGEGCLDKKTWASGGGQCWNTHWGSGSGCLGDTEITVPG